MRFFFENSTVFFVVVVAKKIMKRDFAFKFAILTHFA